MIRIHHQWLILSFILPVICAFTLSCTQANTLNQQTNTSNQQANISNQPKITLEEATHVLNQTVLYATNHNLDGLCGMGGSVLMCQQLFENAGRWDAVPTQYPEIIDSYILPTKDCGNGTYINGGRMLVLKGINGLGKPYQADFLVFNNSETGLLSAQYPIYWGNLSIGQTDCNGSAYVSSSQTQ